MKITLVFDEWRGEQNSELGVEQTQEIQESEANMSFHAGCSFPVQIKVDAFDELAFRRLLAKGYTPTFWATKDTQ